MFAGSTKRKPAVKCAAANDDEDDFGSLAETKEKKKSRSSKKGNDEAGGSKESEQKGDVKKEKEFAWMDSDDEDEKKDEGAKVEEEELQVTVATLNEIQSFGRMMLYSEALSKKLRKGKPTLAELVAAVQAMARSKFFDGDMLEDFYSEIRNLLRADKIEAAQVSEIMYALHSLNAYEKRLFSAIARTFKSKVGTLDSKTQQDWHLAFTDFKHGEDQDFLQMLEASPLSATNPAYRKVRCQHHQKGTCVLDKACSFSHDPRAPLTLEVNGKEDYWRTGALVMTNNQRSLGGATYGGTKFGQPQMPAAMMGAAAPGVAMGMPGVMDANYIAMLQGAMMSGTMDAATAAASGYVFPGNGLS